ncbi:MAG: glycosyltransferase family 4 protein [Beijerinckiaceae bacterium]|jgi:glycosyltransferase involved in cell wall biosynthesis|nr:glycosyltransferase family 4 protein [Beijerinckiaceae bacterium]
MPRCENGPIVLLLDSSGLGGIETHVATLAATLRAAGESAQILFLTDHGPNPFHTQLQALDLPFAVLDGRVGSLWLWLRRVRPRLLHTHGYKAGLIGRLVARARGLPVVSTFHAGERAPFPVGLYQRLDEWTSLLAERIAVSAPIAEKLPFLTTFIPNFIRIPAVMERPKRVPRIAFVGRLSPEKAPDRFCALARRVQAPFHLYGDGPMRAALERDFADCVTFHGFRTDMQAVWPEIDLLIIPSRAEGLPMAALEAIARGIPLIATDVGALSTVIGEGEAGFLVSDGPDEVVIASAAKALDQWLGMGEAARSDLSSCARERAIRYFGEGPALAAIRAVYARACRQC